MVTFDPLGSQSRLPSIDVDKYLERIKCERERVPGLRYLKTLHKSHLLQIPFENLDIHLGNQIILDVQKVYDKDVYKRQVVSQPSHKDFDLLLKKHVDNNGGVNYKAFKNDEEILKDYLIEMMLEPPTREWSNDEKLTYWINVYNALTIQLVLKYYPIKSIKDIGSSIQIPYVNTPWDIKCFEIKDGEELSLNNIEHGIIRKEFDEPRIHFALVCAATSCPKLLNEAYDAQRLDAQLTKQTKGFLANTNKNKIAADRLQLSKLFSWYGGDFRKNGSLVDFLNPYSPVKINDKAKTSFLNYDWSLNEQ